MAGTRSGETRRRGWTEDELILVYWALPLMRTLGRMTGRNFAAIAMKLGNLLAVETSNREGLANASALDRAIVGTYAKDRRKLEQRVLQLLAGRTASKDRSNDIQREAIDILKLHGAPLHAELVSLLLAARSPLLIAQASTVRESLRSSEYAAEVSKDVFRYTEGKGNISGRRPNS